MYQVSPGIISSGNDELDRAANDEGKGWRMHD